MNTHEIVDGIMASLVEQEAKIYETYLTKLIAVNAEAGGHEDGYYYGGSRFSLKKAFELNGLPLRTIHPNLENDAEYVYNLRLKQEQDFQKIRQGISNVLTVCYSLQDIKNTLPDLFTDGLQWFSGVYRTDEVGCALKDNELLHKQFMKVVEISERYLINRLVY